jgi:flagellar hook-length control protein FliK
MKIVGSESPIEDPNANGDNVESTDSSEDESTNTFAQMLAKRRIAADDREAKPKNAQRPPDGFESAVRGGAQPNEGKLQQAAAVKEAVATHAVEVPRELQQLVHEIAVSVGASKHKQVSIELNSNVLQGLHIQIEQQAAGVKIQFTSGTEAVGALLTRNMNALAEGLAERGVQVADIHVTSGSGRDRGFPRGGAGRSGQSQQGRR